MVPQQNVTDPQHWTFNVERKPYSIIFNVEHIDGTQGYMMWMV